MITKPISKRYKSYILTKTFFVFFITFYFLIFITSSYPREVDWQCGYIINIAINSNQEFRFTPNFTTTSTQPNDLGFRSDNEKINNLIKMAYFTRSSVCISWSYYESYWYVKSIRIPASE